MDVESQDAEALPVRTRRSRPGGRHRSPHSLAVPSHAPALVLAVPGPAGPANTAILNGIVAEIVGSADAGGQVRESAPRAHIGYLDGAQEAQDSIASVLAGFDGSSPSQVSASQHGADTARPSQAPPAVVVPLLTGPHPRHRATLDQAVDSAPVPVTVTGPLGPHPLLAGALHVRLAEAGLARADRVRMVSVVTAAEGLIVATTGGQEAVEAAEATAVLLAARLAVPVVAAGLDGTPSLHDAAARLGEMGATRLAVAPCLIGPEVGNREQDELAAVAATIGASYCAPLGAHPDVAKLVGARYAEGLDEALAQGELA